MTFQEKILNIEPINLLEYVDEIPELQSLANTQQCITWHQEGNVLEHTNLVMKEVYKICQTIDHPEEKKNLYLAALLHDFGKPYTTFTKDNGKIVAYGHEQVGVIFARDFLKKYFPQFGFARREYILSLVEFHGYPKRMIKDGSDDLRFKRLSLEANTEQLYNLETADFTGRIGETTAKSIGYLEDFKQKCQNLDIWGKYWTLPNSQHLSIPVYNIARWNILFNGMKEDDVKRIEKIQQRMPKEPFELRIMCGVPGSGKTTYIAKLYPHIEKICMDDERAKLGDVNDMSKNDYIFQICCKQLTKRMKARQNTIWDATSVNRKMRKLLINIARQNGAVVSIVYFDLKLDTILKRNSEREKKVPEEVVKQYYMKLQVPCAYEYDKLLVVDENTKFE